MDNLPPTATPSARTEIQQDCSPYPCSLSSPTLTDGMLTVIAGNMPTPIDVPDQPGPRTDRPSAHPQHFGEQHRCPVQVTVFPGQFCPVSHHR
eukprot:m.242211 g.242211  ORF g.242211 m.242211 type:complete len:93 (-) comp19437_c1_seq4:298-576(-)